MAIGKPQPGPFEHGDLAERRAEMVRRQIAARGVGDNRVLDALREVPRHVFVAPGLIEFAYDDTPLPIAAGQTISQPYVVALMIELAEVAPGDRVLDVGTGSGYAAAVISRIAAQVFGIERHAELVEDARAALRHLHYDNIAIELGDGSRGWAEHAPYDAILAAAGAPDLPRALLDQLAPGGRLVMPVGGQDRAQRLLRVREKDGDYRRERLGACSFVPLIGEQGWREPAAKSKARRARRAAPSPGT